MGETCVRKKLPWEKVQRTRNRIANGYLESDEYTPYPRRRPRLNHLTNPIGFSGIPHALLSRQKCIQGVRPWVDLAPGLFHIPRVRWPEWFLSFARLKLILRFPRNLGVEWQDFRCESFRILGIPHDLRIRFPRKPFGKSQTSYRSRYICGNLRNERWAPILWRESWTCHRTGFRISPVFVIS